MQTLSASLLLEVPFPYELHARPLSPLIRACVLGMVFILSSLFFLAFSLFLVNAQPNEAVRPDLLFHATLPYRF